MQYIAFLRGVNVGGVTVKMTDAKVLFEGLGFKNIITVLASGNILFESEKGTLESLTRKIESGLRKKYKREITVMLRTMDEIRAMERSRPFKGIESKSTTRFYVTFMYEPSRGVRIPDMDPNFRILRIKDMDAFSVLEVSDEIGTVDAMTKLSKIFGPKITMRNWNTITKILKAADLPPIS